MIGNDIVDLKQAAIESNWKRKRFLNKIFTQKEEEYISNSKCSHQMVWQLWSMKESAYKINIQHNQNRLFNPKKIECTLINTTKGIVKIDDANYFTTSKIEAGAYIHTIARLNESIPLKAYCFPLNASVYKIQHQFCHSQLKEIVAQKYNSKPSSISIKKNTLGVPKLYNNNQRLNINCSISHHGHYGAYVLS